MSVHSMTVHEEFCSETILGRLATLDELAAHSSFREEPADQGWPAPKFIGVT
jgi:hypothetical protein